MANFSLKVQARSLGPEQFRWEIYRDGDPGSPAVDQSRGFYKTEAGAWEAGRKALVRRESIEATRDVNTRAKRIVSIVTDED